MSKRKNQELAKRLKMQLESTSSIQVRPEEYEGSYFDFKMACEAEGLKVQLGHVCTVTK